MKKIFGLRKKKKEKPPPVTLEEATEKINRRGDVTDEKIKRLDAELLIFKEHIKKTRPGPAQDALKARALRVLKQKKMYEAQRDMLYNQSFKLERVSFATEGIKDARETLAAMKASSKDLNGTFKTLKIDDVDKLQDVITDIVEESNEIHDSLMQGSSIPDQLDEDDLLGELSALEDDVKTSLRVEAREAQQAKDEDIASANVSLQPNTSNLDHSAELGPDEEDEEEEPTVPAVPRSSIRT